MGQSTNMKGLNLKITQKKVSWTVPTTQPTEVGTALGTVHEITTSDSFHIKPALGTVLE